MINSDIDKNALLHCTRNRKQHEAFDIVKIICCILIVCIHTKPLPNVFQPVYRISVPLFFMISSYLFFERISALESSEQNKYLRRFFKRSLKLYFFWFIVLFPTSFIFFYSSWFNNGFLKGILRFVEQFLFSYTFAIPSWYIMATIIGVLIVYSMNRLKLKWVLPIVGFGTYIICCITSNYETLFSQDGLFNNIIIGGGKLKPQNSFLVSLIWVYIGYYFVNHRIRVKLYMIPICLILLYIEYFIINKKIGIPESQDNYIMLVPLCVLLFVYILGLNVKYTHCVTLRKMSTIIFCFHHPFATVVNILLLHKGIETGFLNFTITIIVSLLVCCIIFKLEKNKYFKWLKYSY